MVSVSVSMVVVMPVKPWGIAGIRVDVGWGSFSVVTVSLILKTSSLSHLLRNDSSIATQSFFSSFGNSSNQSSASLSTPK